MIIWFAKVYLSSHATVITIFRVSAAVPASACRTTIPSFWAKTINPSSSGGCHISSGTDMAPTAVRTLPTTNDSITAPAVRVIPVLAVLRVATFVASADARFAGVSVAPLGVPVNVTRSTVILGEVGKAVAAVPLQTKPIERTYAFTVELVLTSQKNPAVAAWAAASTVWFP